MASSSLPPMEVVLVSRREGIPKNIAEAVLLSAVNGLLLMFLLPLAHRVLGTPALAPGYLDCWLLALLTRATFAGVFARAVALSSAPKRKANR